MPLWLPNRLADILQSPHVYSAWEVTCTGPSKYKANRGVGSQFKRGVLEICFQLLRYKHDIVSRRAIIHRYGNTHLVSELLNGMHIEQKIPRARLDISSFYKMLDGPEMAAVSNSISF